MECNVVFSFPSGTAESHTLTNCMRVLVPPLPYLLAAVSVRGAAPHPRHVDFFFNPLLPPLLSPISTGYFSNPSIDQNSFPPILLTEGLLHRFSWMPGPNESDSFKFTHQSIFGDNEIN